jgi:hypothetical protein
LDFDQGLSMRCSGDLNTLLMSLNKANHACLLARQSLMSRT